MSFETEKVANQMTVRNLKITLYLGTLGKSRKSLLNIVEQYKNKRQIECHSLS
jgi:hypothetical protein